MEDGTKHLIHLTKSYGLCPDTDLAPVYEPLLTREDPDYYCWQVVQEEKYERPPRLRVSVTVTEVRQLRPGIVQHNDVELFTVRASSATLMCVVQKGNRMRRPRGGGVDSVSTFASSNVLT